MMATTTQLWLPATGANPPPPPPPPPHHAPFWSVLITGEREDRTPLIQVPAAAWASGWVMAVAAAAAQASTILWISHKACHWQLTLAWSSKALMMITCFLFSTDVAISLPQCLLSPRIQSLFPTLRRRSSWSGSRHLSQMGTSHTTGYPGYSR